MEYMIDPKDAGEDFDQEMLLDAEQDHGDEPAPKRAPKVDLRFIIDADDIAW